MLVAACVKVLCKCGGNIWLNVWWCEFCHNYSSLLWSTEWKKLRQTLHLSLTGVWLKSLHQFNVFNLIYFHLFNLYFPSVCPPHQKSITYIKVDLCDLFNVHYYENRDLFILVILTCCFKIKFRPLQTIFVFNLFYLFLI